MEPTTNGALQGPNGQDVAQFGSPGAGSPETLAHLGGGHRLVSALGLGASGGSVGTGGVTPPRSRPRGKVLMLTPGSSGGAGRGGDVSPGPSVLSAVKRELELMEAKLFAEMEQRCGAAMQTVERSDKIREMALQHVHQKLADLDEAKVRMDKRVAESNGQVKGLQDEVQRSSRWADTVDQRLWEFRHQVEEEFRDRCSELEASSKEILSKIRSTSLANEDIQTKLTQTTRRLDGAVQDVSQNNDTLAQALALQQERLQAVEDMASNAIADLQDRLLVLESSSKVCASQVRQSETHVDSRLLDLEQQIKEYTQQVSRLQATAHGENGWELKLNDHETRLAAMRSKLESYEQYSARVDEAVRQKWGGQIDKLEKHLEETIGCHQDMAEKHEVLARQAETRHEELLERLQQLEHDSKGLQLFVTDEDEVPDGELLSGQISPVHHAPPAGLHAPSAVPVPRTDLRMAAEDHHAAVDGSAQRTRSPRPTDADAGLTTRVGALVSQLKEMVPSMHETKDVVRGHVEELAELTRRVQGVESSVKKLLEGSTNVVQTITAHAESASRVGTRVGSTENSPALGGENLDQLLMKYDESETKILDAHKKLRQRMDNVQHLLEAVDKQAVAAGAGSPPRVHVDIGSAARGFDY